MKYFFGQISTQVSETVHEKPVKYLKTVKNC